MQKYCKNEECKCELNEETEHLSFKKDVTGKYTSLYCRKCVTALKSAYYSSKKKSNIVIHKGVKVKVIGKKCRACNVVFDETNRYFKVFYEKGVKKTTSSLSCKTCKEMVLAEHRKKYHDRTYVSKKRNKKYVVRERKKIPKVKAVKIPKIKKELIIKAPPEDNLLKVVTVTIKEEKKSDVFLVLEEQTRRENKAVVVDNDDFLRSEYLKYNKITILERKE